MKKIFLLSLILGMSFSILYASRWYYDLGGGYVINQTFHVSQRFGYQISTEPSLFLTIETAYEGEHEREFFRLMSRCCCLGGGHHWERNTRKHHQSFFLAPGIMYYPMTLWQVSASMGIEYAVAVGGGVSEWDIWQMYGYSNKREPSFALKLSTAYDLSQTRHGFQVGMQYFWANCESIQSATLGVFLKYRYKGSNHRRARQERPARETIRHW